jgi:hypothetical protein
VDSCSFIARSLALKLPGSKPQLYWEGSSYHWEVYCCCRVSFPLWNSSFSLQEWIFISCTSGEARLMETPSQWSLPPVCKLQKIIPGVGARMSSYNLLEISSSALPLQIPSWFLFNHLLSIAWMFFDSQRGFFTWSLSNIWSLLQFLNFSRSVGHRVIVLAHPDF